MNQPLGQYVGNALEIYECIKILRGEAGECAQSTAELSFELSARMLVLSGTAESVESARKLVESKIANGEALELVRKNSFAIMCRSLRRSGKAARFRIAKHVSSLGSGLVISITPSRSAIRLRVGGGRVARMMISTTHRYESVLGSVPKLAGM